MAFSQLEALRCAFTQQGYEERCVLDAGKCLPELVNEMYLAIRFLSHEAFTGSLVSDQHPSECIALRISGSEKWKKCYELPKISRIAANFAWKERVVVPLQYKDFGRRWEWCGRMWSEELDWKSMFVDYFWAKDKIRSAYCMHHLISYFEHV